MITDSSSPSTGSGQAIGAMEALRVLDVLLESILDDTSTGEIAGKLKFSESKVRRYCQALTEFGWIEETKGHAWRVGSRWQSMAKVMERTQDMRERKFENEVSRIIHEQLAR